MTDMCRQTTLPGIVIGQANTQLDSVTESGYLETRTSSWYHGGEILAEQLLRWLLFVGR